MTTLTSPRHPNWIIEKSDTGFWSMWHQDYSGYLISINKINEQWVGEIFTEQKIQDMPSETFWGPAQENPFEGTIDKVKAEVVRRGTYWNSKK